MERGRQGVLRMAVGVFDQELGVFSEQRLAALHSAVADECAPGLTVGLKFTERLMPANAQQKLVEIMNAPPLTVADHIDTGLLLHADGENHHLVHNPTVFVRSDRVATIDQAAYQLRAWQRPNDLRIE